MAAIFTGRDLIVDFEENPASGADHQYRIEYQCANSTVVHYVANSDFRAVDAQGNRQYVDTLTYEENRAAGLTRTPTVRLYTQNANGKWSSPAVVQANNPQPTLPSTPTVTPTVNGVVVNITRPQDNDVVGYRIWRSASSPVARTDANLVFDGPDTSPTIPLPNLGNFFIVVAPYDGFDMQGLNVSPEIQVSAAPPQAGPTGPSGPPGSTGPAGPALVITKSEPGNFTFSDGVASPANQTVTFTAVRQNVSGPITWTTQPNVGGGTGDTFQITLAQMGVAKVILVTASAGGVVAGSSVSKLADPGADKTGDNIANGIKNQSEWATWPGLTPAILEQNLNSAIADANESKIHLANAAADGKITPTEKKVARERRSNIANEFPIWRDRAIEFGVDAGIRTNYQLAYDQMNTYLDSININLNTTTNVVRADYVASFGNYAVWRTKIIEAISQIARTQALWSGVTGAGRPEDNADVTSGKTAAAITGQGPWATTTVPVNQLTTVRPNLFPYPFAPVDGRLPSQIGWQNATGGGGSLNGVRLDYLDGAAYVYSRPNGGTSQTVYPFFDMPISAGLQISVGLTGYGGGQANPATFHPYVEFLNSNKSSILGSATLTYNSTSDRFVVNGVTTPANTAYLRIVPRGIFPASSQYQDVVFWAIKVERGAFATAVTDSSYVRLPAADMEYNNGQSVGSLRPAEFGSNVTESRVASAIAGQGQLATRNEILPSLGNGSRFSDNLIPDNEYKDMAWWGAASLPNFYFVSPDAAWSMPRLLEFNSDRNFDITSQFFTLEKGSTYRIRCRIWNNDTAKGWSGAFWPMIHIPGQAWFSLKHGTSINPDIADANNAIVANGDTLDQEFYFTPQNNNARQVQFRFKSTARGSQVAMQFHISKVTRLGRDFINNNSNLPYVVGDIQTNLGVASSITGQGDLATRNAASLPFGSNYVVNSDFTRGTWGWLANKPTSHFGVNLPGWHGHRNVMWMNHSGTLANGSNFDVNPATLWNGGGVNTAPRYAVPVVQGDQVYVSTLAARHRCTFQLWILVFNSAGSLFDTHVVSGGRDGGAAGGDPSNFDKLSIIRTMPANARWVIPMMRMVGTGENNPYIFFTEPACGKIAPGQTVAPAYTSGRNDPDADVTAGNVAGAVTGQTEWATLTLPSTRIHKLNDAGRVNDPTAYNTQAILGPRNITNLSPTYTVGASNVTVNLPAHNRRIAGPFGPITLNYGASSGVVAFNSYWTAYIDDPNLTGFSSPSVAFTTDPNQLLFPGRYQIASGIAPNSAGSGGGTGSGGGGSWGGGGGAGGGGPPGGPGTEIP